MTAEVTYEKGWAACSACHTKRPKREMEAGKCRDATWCAAQARAQFVQALWTKPKPDMPREEAVSRMRSWFRRIRDRLSPSHANGVGHG